MKKLLLGLLVLGFFATNVQADNFSSGNRIFTDIVAIGTDQYIAEDICEFLAKKEPSKDHRLPTARELAEFAQLHGGKVSERPKNGYFRVEGSDEYGSPDVFYYDGRNFDFRGKEIMKGKTLFSGSIPYDTDFPNNPKMVITLDLSNGWLGDGQRQWSFSTNAVVCMMRM